MEKEILNTIEENQKKNQYLYLVNGFLKKNLCTKDGVIYALPSKFSSKTSKIIGKEWSSKIITIKPINLNKG